MKRCKFNDRNQWLQALNTWYGQVTFKSTDHRLDAFSKTNWQLLGEFNEKTMSGYLTDRRVRQQPVDLEKRMQLEVLS